MSDTTPFDLDALMSIDPLDLTTEDLTRIIAYHRDLRAEREAGKGKAVRARNKAKAEGAPTKLDISALMSSLVKTTPSGGTLIKRRV